MSLSQDKSLVKKSLQENKGGLLPFQVDFKSAGKLVSPEEQAKIILDEVKQLQSDGAKKVGITYSANQEQTNKIISANKQGNFKTGTKGTNQAAVIQEIERLLETQEYEHLQGVYQTIPITTMKYVGPFKRAADDSSVDMSLQNAREFTEAGGVLLGWTNQETKQGELAIGGGVAEKVQPPAQKKHIEQWAKSMYADSPFVSSTYAYSLDYDGCIAAASIEEILKQNKDLIQEIVDKINDGHTVTLFIGSNRQHIKKDHQNSNKRQGKSPSVYSALPAIQKEIKNKLGEEHKANIHFEPMLATDLHNNMEPGHYFEHYQKISYVKHDVTPDNDAKDELNSLDEHTIYEDETKVSTIYAQMQYFANKNKGKDCEFVFVDDRADILDGLYLYYSKHPNLIPNNVTLRLEQKVSKESHDVVIERFKEIENDLDFNNLNEDQKWEAAGSHRQVVPVETRVIKGNGKINNDYQEEAVQLAKYAAENDFDNPYGLLDGDIRKLKGSKANIENRLSLYLTEREKGNEYKDRFGLGISLTQKKEAIEALKLAMKGHNVDLNPHRRALRDGKLGNTLRELAKQGEFDIYATKGKQIRTVSKLIDTLDKKGSVDNQKDNVIQQIKAEYAKQNLQKDIASDNAEPLLPQSKQEHQQEPGSKHCERNLPSQQVALTHDYIQSCFDKFKDTELTKFLKICSKLYPDNHFLEVASLTKKMEWIARFNKVNQLSTDKIPTSFFAFIVKAVITRTKNSAEELGVNIASEEFIRAYNEDKDYEGEKIPPSIKNKIMEIYNLKAGDKLTPKILQNENKKLLSLKNKVLAEGFDNKLDTFLTQEEKNKPSLQ